MNIAVVDDEEIIIEQIRGFIKKRNPGFNISGFATGEGLLAAGKDFDIIFLDIQMEGMGGTVTYYQQTWLIGKDGSIQSTVYSVTETGMTNAERMKKNMDERLEKQKEKKEEEETEERRKDVR